MFVTDRGGNPIKGLKREDFEIFEDGRPVAITNFYSVDDDGKPRPSALTLPPVPAGPPPESLRQPDPVPEEQRLYMVVYIDNFNIKPFNRNRVFRRIREFLSDNVESDDRVMLVTYNRSFKERVSFTSDAALVNSARSRSRRRPLRLHRESDRNDLLRQIEDAESAGGIGQVRPTPARSTTTPW